MVIETGENLIDTENVEQPSKSKQKSQKRLFSMKEVSRHATYDSCWIAIWDNVYDVTQYLSEHPGGTEIILEYAGSDATNGFLGKGHSIAALEELEKYIIGLLVEEDRQYPCEIIPSF